MKYGKLPHVNKPISRLVQGTIMCKTAEQAYVNDLLDAVYATGINTFDTAHNYGRGESEKSLGAWINSEAFGIRSSFSAKGPTPMTGSIGSRRMISGPISPNPLSVYRPTISISMFFIGMIPPSRLGH